MHCIFLGVVPPAHYSHWLLLVNAARLIFKREISKEDIQKSKLLIAKFISQMPELYSLHNVSYNNHILQHIVETVEYWGAPWASSAFVYEDCGGKLKKLYSLSG